MKKYTVILEQYGEEGTKERKVSAATAFEAMLIAQEKTGWIAVDAFVPAKFMNRDVYI